VSARFTRVDVVASALIVLSVVWRGLISARGFLTIDDFPILAQADAAGLTPGHLFEVYNNHLMPAGRLIVFVTERLTGYAYWPYLVLMLLAQLAVGVAFYRLLRLMLPAFRAGLAGRLGSGRQYFSVISLRDWVGAVRFLIEHEDAAGAFNLVGLHPPTNNEFTKALAAKLHRPAVLWVPQTPMRLALGGLAGELLGSLRMRPSRLVAAGFEHRDRDLDAVLDAALAT